MPSHSGSGQVAPRSAITSCFNAWPRTYCILIVRRPVPRQYSICVPQRPPSPTWRTFLATHAKALVSIDFFTVATVRFEILYVLVILAHDRRRVRLFNITAHPTAQWTAQQVVEAFPWDTAPRHLLRDRDAIYGTAFRARVAALGSEEVLSAPRSPWQSPYVERLIGSIRRECLDNVVVLPRRHLHRILTAYFEPADFAEQRIANNAARRITRVVLRAIQCGCICVDGGCIGCWTSQHRRRQQ
jgi:transposase InsO family protein